MSIRFRIKGLCETIVDTPTCPHCEYEESLDKVEPSVFVTMEGIIASITCSECEKEYIPNTQDVKILNSQKLIKEVVKDKKITGMMFWNKQDIQDLIDRQDARKH